MDIDPQRKTWSNFIKLTFLGTFDNFPEDKSSIPNTLYPSSLNLFANLDPTKPATPVIKIFFFNLFFINYI